MLHESHRRTLWTAAATALTIQQLITRIFSDIWGQL